MQMKAEMRMLLEGARSGDATRRREFDLLQFVLDHIQLSQLVDGRKALVSRETLGIVAVGGPPVATTTVEAEWYRFKESQKMVKKRDASGRSKQRPGRCADDISNRARIWEQRGRETPRCVCVCGQGHGR